MTPLGSAHAPNRLVSYVEFLAMRVTGPLIKVLSVLLEVGQAGDEAYGLEISRRTGLKSGTLYPILDRLEDAGWVESRWEESEPSRNGRPRRRFYRLTSAGAHEARATLAEYGVSGTVRWT
jgi:PadR family transcriptional regulator PadR